MQSPSGNLLKVLGLAFGVAVLIGNTIGMGILQTPGKVAGLLPSVPLFMTLWVVGATYALLGAMTIAELGTMHPRSGGQYPLVYDALGPFPGFVVGWTDWISTAGSTGLVAMGLGTYLQPFLPESVWKPAHTACIVVIAIALLQWRGIRVGDVAQQITSVLKALALVGLALVALFVTPRGLPVAPIAVAAVTIPTGIALATAIIVGLQSIIFTYDGWTGPIYFSEEVKNPGRDIPRSMIGGVLLVLVIYLVLNVAFLRVIPIREMAGDTLVAASVAKRLFGPGGDTVLRVLILISLLSSVNALTLIASRVPYAMSKDRLLPTVFSHANPGGTPVASLVVSTIVTLIFVVTNTIDSALALLAFFFVANYAQTFTSLFVLRRQRPDAPRPFRVPLYPFVPGIVLAGSLAFLVAQVWGDRTNSLIAVGLIALSWPAFLIVRRLIPR